MSRLTRETVNSDLHDFAGGSRLFRLIAGWRQMDDLAFHDSMNYSSYNYMTIGIYKTKWLARFTRRERITDGSLREAIDRAERGIVDADLGGGLIKQRVAREGQGRSGGYRMLVAYRQQGRAVFLYGFAKNEQDNIGPMSWRR